MSPTPLDDLLDRLDRTAREASTAEDAYRRDVLQRIKEMERERAFAFRRLTLVRTVASAVADAKDEDEARARGSSAFLREIGWNGASESQREVVTKFTPVILALWEVTRPEGGDAGAAPEQELVAFEQWFVANRNGPFLALMDGEVLELPLVEV